MNSEIQALLEKAERSIEAARLLQKQGHSDFAASRAYYALFYIAEALLLHKGMSFSSHSGVIAAYGKEYAKTERLDVKFHRYLIDAQDLRNIGDYATGHHLSPEQVVQMCVWGDEFLQAARQILGS